MRYAYLLLCGVILSSCAQQASSPADSTYSLVPGGRERLSGANVVTSRAASQPPNIVNVSPISKRQYQRIVITGTGFGSMRPYDGDSPYIEFQDVYPYQWSAGHTYPSGGGDGMTLRIALWQPTKIVITGFTGEYGVPYPQLYKHDHIVISVWNAKTGVGPSQFDAYIGKPD